MEQSEKFNTGLRTRIIYSCDRAGTFDFKFNIFLKLCEKSGMPEHIYAIDHAHWSSPYKLLLNNFQWSS